jgi:hypothetical protein
MDQSSFQFVKEDPSALNTWLKSSPSGLAGLVCFGDLPGTDKDDLVLPIRKFTVHIPARGHNPVIIDQSVVPSALLQGMAMARSDGTTSRSCPDEVRNSIQDIASSIAQAYHLARGADDMNDKSGSDSSGIPGYLLVHENVLALMLTTLKSTLPPNFQPHVQALDAAEDILASSQLDYVPVFSVRSLDHAMDTVTNRLPSSPLAYVFAEKRFGEYAAGNLERKSVAINDIPRRLASTSPNHWLPGDRLPADHLLPYWIYSDLVPISRRCLCFSKRLYRQPRARLLGVRQAFSGLWQS